MFVTCKIHVYILHGDILMTQSDLLFFLSLTRYISGSFQAKSVEMRGLHAHALAESHVEMFAIDAHTVLNEWLK